MFTNNLKFKLIICISTLGLNPAFAGMISKPFHFTTGTTIFSSEVNSNFDKLFTEMNNKEIRLNSIEANGWVTSARILNGAVTTAKFAAGAGIIPETTRTINVTSAMTQAQIQAAIDGIGRYIPHGVVVTVQFADGTYNWSTQLMVGGFYGGGTVTLTGNTTEVAALHINQAVHIDCTTMTSGACVYILNNSNVTVSFNYFKLTFPSAIAWRSGLIYNNARGNVSYNYFVGNGTGAAGDAVATYAYMGSSIIVVSNYYSNVRQAIAAALGGVAASNNNDDTGVMPAYGLMVTAGGYIGQIPATTQPSGSISNTVVSVGVGIY